VPTKYNHFSSQGSYYGVSFTLKSSAESLVLMNVVLRSFYPKWHA